MNDCKVLHLVSNALEHPENTASNFKVSYNTPFDFTGKKVALVSVSLTKGQPNFVANNITFNYIPRTKTHVTVDKLDLEYYKQVLKREELPAEEREGTDKPVFSLHRKESDGSQKNLAKIILEDQNLIQLTSDTAKMELVYTIQNLSNGTVEVSLFSFNDTTKGWEYGNLSNKFPEFEIQELGMKYIFELHPSEILQFTMISYVLGKLHLENTPTRQSDYKEKALALYENMPLSIRCTETELIGVKKEDDIIQFQTRHFKDPEAIVKYVNGNRVFKKLAKLSYENGKLCFTVLRTTPACRIELNEFQHLLGFRKNIILHALYNMRNKYVAEEPPDLTRGIHHYYIYCSLVKNNFVNNKPLQILAAVDATKSAYGEQFFHSVQYPSFVDCVEGLQQMIEVTISDDVGEVKNLLAGRTNLTLVIKD